MRSRGLVSLVFLALLLAGAASLAVPPGREATLHRIQQLMHERAMFAPIWNIASLNAYGPRVAESGLGLIASYLFSAPYEDVRLKGR